jgi:shikimate dehydrogenase
MKQYGLIGYPLSHSFSPQFFNNKFDREGVDAHYDVYPLSDVKEIKNLLKNHSFSGLNVTIPYKESIIPYLDRIDDEAALIGAVNTIRFEDGKTTGYNTDVFGFEKSLMALISHPSNVKGALVLGTGGSAKAVWYVLQKLNILYLTVSRSRGQLTYADIDSAVINDYPLIVNTTPVGMYPNVTNAPDLPYALIGKNNFLYDLVYNPQKTLFLSEGISRDASVKNGQDMLIYQAERAYEIWNL